MPKTGLHEVSNVIQGNFLVTNVTTLVTLHGSTTSQDLDQLVWFVPNYVVLSSGCVSLFV